MNGLHECSNKQSRGRREGQELSQRGKPKLGMLIPLVYSSSLITHCVSSWNCLTPSYSPFTPWHRDHLLQEALHVDRLSLRHTATRCHRTLCHGQ